MIWFRKTNAGSPISLEISLMTYLEDKEVMKEIWKACLPICRSSSKVKTKASRRLKKKTRLETTITSLNKMENNHLKKEGKNQCRKKTNEELLNNFKKLYNYNYISKL